jgi:hypothetical protein
VIPTTNEVGSPLSFDDLLEARHCCERSTAKRIAVKVNNGIVGNEKFVAKGRKRVLLI